MVDEVKLDFSNRSFCGRQNELDHLKRIQQICFQQQKTRCVFVGGKSGTGKSALVNEFIEHHAGKYDKNSKDQHTHPNSCNNRSNYNNHNNNEAKTAAAPASRSDNDNDTISRRQRPTWCCRGKYDQSSSRPYGGIADCYNEVVGYMVDEDVRYNKETDTDSNYKPWSTILEEDSRVDYSFLIPLLPNIRHLIHSEETNQPTTAMANDNNEDGTGESTEEFVRRQSDGGWTGLSLDSSNGSNNNNHRRRKGSTKEFVAVPPTVSEGSISEDDGDDDDGGGDDTTNTGKTIVAEEESGVSSQALQQRREEEQEQHRPRRFSLLSRSTSDSSRNSWNRSSAAGGRDGERSRSTSGAILNVDRLLVTLRSLTNLASKRADLILVYEDVQWADKASISLFRRFFSSVAAIGALIIGTHRPLPPDHFVHRVQALERVLDESARTTSSIQLDVFDVDDVTTYLRHLFKRSNFDSDDDKLIELAQVIQHKTGGNPCAVHDFARILESEKFISFDLLHTYRWVWDVEKIKIETDMSADIVQLALRRLQSLDSPLLRLALMIAAFLGSSSFDARVLYSTISPTKDQLTRIINGIIPEDSGEEKNENGDYDYAVTTQIKDVESLQTLLDLACDDGLLEAIPGTSLYKFSHDSVLEACVELIPKDVTRCRQLHYSVGYQLLDILRDDSDEPLISSSRTSILLDAMAHINEAVEIIMTSLSSDQILELVKWNYEAAQFAIEAACLESAVKYLETGLKMIDDVRWTDHYIIGLQLSERLAELYFGTNQVEKCEALIEDIHSNAKTLNDTLGAHRTRILLRMFHEDFDGALDAAVSITEKVTGAKFPRRFRKLHAVYRVLKMKNVLVKATPEQILDLPPVDDQKMVTAISFLNLLSVVANHTNDADMFLLSSLEATKLTLKYGRVAGSSFSLALGAGPVLSTFGEIDHSYRISKAVLSMAAQHESSQALARSIGALYLFSIHWKSPQQECLQPLLEAGETLLKAGDVTYVAFSFLSYLLMYYYCGLRLQAYMEDARKLDQVLTDYGQVYFLTILRCRIQMVDNLMGSSDTVGSPTNLTGQFMDQSKCIQEWESNSNLRALYTMYLCRLYLAYFFDEDGLAEEMSSKLPSVISEGTGPWLPSRILFQGLAAFRLARKYRKKRRKNLRLGAQCTKWMEKRVAIGCVNCPHYLALLLAEQYRTMKGGSNWAAGQKKYDHAILLSGRLGFLNIQALANDLAGQFFLEEVQDIDWTRTYLNRSIELYEQWGAYAVSKYVRMKYSHILRQENDAAEAALSGNTGIGTHFLSRSRFDSVKFGSKRSSSGFSSSNNRLSSFRVQSGSSLSG